MNEREIDEIDNEEYMLNEMYTGPSQTTEMYTVENNNSKGKNGWILFLIFTTLLFGGLFTYYLFVSKKCKEKPTDNNKINFDKLTNTDEFRHWLLYGNRDRYRNKNFEKILWILDNDQYLRRSKTKLQDAKLSQAVTGYEPRGNHFAQPGEDFGF